MDVNKYLRLQVALNSRYVKIVIRYSFYRIFAERQESHVSRNEIRSLCDSRCLSHCSGSDSVSNRVFLSAVYNRTGVLIFLSVSRPKHPLTANCLQRMMSSSANYRPFCVHTFARILRFLFFLVLSESRPKLCSSSANYRSFLSSFRHIPPSGGGSRYFFIRCKQNSPITSHAKLALCKECNQILLFSYIC